MRTQFHYLIIFLFLVLASACSTVKEVPAVKNNNFTDADVSADSIVSAMPDYSPEFSTVKGKGKAIVSEPESSERVTLYFSSNRERSLITIKSSIGIEGGKLLTDGDTLLVYNKIDKYARKISVRDGNLDDINNLASINILGILNMPVHPNDVAGIMENESTWLLRLQDGSKIYVGKDDVLIRQVDRPQSSALPYSQIKYDGYQKIEGLQLPRRITIFSADESAKIDLLIQSLEVNPDLGELDIELPDDIKIYRR